MIQPVSRLPQGSYVALISPFRNGGLDENLFCRLVESQIEAGSAGIIPCGTTGESPTLSHAEQARLIQLAVQQSAGRAVVLAGAGSNDTVTTVALLKAAEKAGAEHALVVVPYYNRPTQEGLYQHYKFLHDSSGLGLVVYNIPGRSGVDVSDETLCRLAELPRIIGVKDATADLARPARLKLKLPEGFRQFSGEDATMLGFLAQGGDGTIGVVANVAPKLVADIHSAWFAGDIATAMRLRNRITPLAQALFLESNPAPVKYALHRLGLGNGELRLPLVNVTEATAQAVDAALFHAGLLQAKAA